MANGQPKSIDTREIHADRQTRINRLEEHRQQTYFERPWHQQPSLQLSSYAVDQQRVSVTRLSRSQHQSVQGERQKEADSNGFGGVRVAFPYAEPSQQPGDTGKLVMM